MARSSHVPWMLTQSRNTSPKEIKEQLAQLKTWKGGLGKKVQAKIRDKVKNICTPDKLKTRKGNLGVVPQNFPSLISQDIARIISKIAQELDNQIIS